MFGENDMAIDMGRTRKVSINPYQGRIGAPPAPTAAQTASAAKYKGSAKERRDLAAAQARVGKRARKAGRMKSAVVTLPAGTSTALASAGGGGAAALPEEDKAWWQNYWLWLAVAGIWFATRKKGKR